MQTHRKDDDAVGVEALRGHTNRPSRRYPPGRVCGYHGCGTRLSVYNESFFCSLHTPGGSPPVRGKGGV